MASLRAQASQKEVSLELRVKDVEKQLNDRKIKLEEEYDKKCHDFLAAVAQEHR